MENKSGMSGKNDRDLSRKAWRWELAKDILRCLMRGDFVGVRDYSYMFILNERNGK